VFDRWTLIESDLLRHFETKFRPFLAVQSTMVLIGNTRTDRDIDLRRVFDRDGGAFRVDRGSGWLFDFVSFSWD
jgi:hypothetical protein